MGDSTIERLTPKLQPMARYRIVCVTGGIAAAIIWGALLFEKRPVPVPNDFLARPLKDFTITYYRALHQGAPPENRLDPYDTFLKDQNGDLVVAPALTNVYQSIMQAEMRCYQLRTKKDRPVIVYQASPAKRWRFKSNCHGYTFLAGDYWMLGDQVRPVLEDGGWKVVAPSNVRSNDIAIYRDLSSSIVHSAIVVGRDKNDKILVDSKDGFAQLRRSVMVDHPQ